MKDCDYIPQTPCVCISFRRAALKVTELYDKALEPVGVTVNQYSLLVNICRMEGCGTGELAKRVRLEKSTLVRTLQPLLRDGLIIDKSPEENRRRQLHLTTKGEEVLKKAFPLWNKAQEEITAKLGMNSNELANIFRRVLID